MFGPLNQGLSEEKAKEVASESLKMLGISEKFYESNPLDLSGGQKRCIAIAGIIAMKPDILVLDEPTAGLDFKSKNLLFTVLKKIQAEKKSIVLVSHNIEDIAAYANKVWVLHDNQFVLSGDTRKVFNESTVLKK
jgi:ABC-type cobalt transport system, ATPase component